MAIYDQMMGATGVGGHVILLCKTCEAPAQDAKTASTVLKVCSKCGTPLGEWKTEAERNAELRDFAERVKREGVPVMKSFRIRVTSGEQAGRYVGRNIGGGLITNSELLKNREVKVPGTGHSLYAREDGATQFFEGKTDGVQAELRKLGYETELVEIPPKK